MSRPGGRVTDRPSSEDAQPTSALDPRQPSGHTRRDVVRQGVKLAFVAPVITTFFARDAMAAGSNHSCYPTGHACPGAEPCCNGPCVVNVCP